MNEGYKGCYSNGDNIVESDYKRHNTIPNGKFVKLFIYRIWEDELAFRCSAERLAHRDYEFAQRTCPNLAL